MPSIAPQPDWWVISDTHFQHKNINRYCWRTTPAYPTPEAVDQLMYSNWRSLVGKRDTILHLGDLCFWDQGEPIPEMAELPGRKILLRGNHDNYKDEWYEDHGFEVLKDEEIHVRYNHPLALVDVVFSHYPKRHLLPKTVNIHGHVHNNPHEGSSAHINVSVETTHFAPVRLEKVLDKVVWHYSNDITSEGSRRKRR